jgi:hypothetical protein
VRRLCQEIIIVDAEEDPGYAYDAYFKLKHAVEREMGARLSIPDIEWLRELACGDAPFCKEAAYPPQEQPAWRESAIAPLSEGYIEHIPYRAPNACPPEASGTAGNTCDFDRIRVLYLKLAYHPDHDPDADLAPPKESTVLRQVFNDSKCCQKKAACWPEQSIKCDAPFPQLPTKIQSMTPQHFVAYRRLGCRLAVGPLAQALGGKLDPTETQDRCGK